MQTLTEKFKQTVAAELKLPSSAFLLLAVSGGLDSVVLSDLCYRAGYRFAILHVNFRLRGAESERDEQFVRRLAEAYQVPVWVQAFDTADWAAQNKLSVQEAARILRYEWFEEIRSQQETEKGKPVYLLTAHQADDNNETLLMHFFRGTGLHGLTGIPVSYGNIRRPLLGFYRSELESYALENKLSWVEDSSNQSSAYTRNFFRNEILPAVRRIYPQVQENLQYNISRFRDAEVLYRQSVERLKKKLCKPQGADMFIPVKLLMAYRNKALVYEIIRDYGFGEKQVDELYKLADSESGRYLESPAFHYRIIKHRDWFVISPVHTAESAIRVVEENEKQVIFEKGILQIEKKGWSGQPVPDKENEVWLDSRQLHWPLLLRKWKAGDYFYPLGMKKKKKVARFLIDRKLSLSQKEDVWVLESNKRICWVIGLRMDERFRLKENSTHIIAFRWLS